MKLSARIKILITVALVGLFITNGAFYFVLNELKVNGKIYFGIIQGKDIAADILPPPEYIVESQLVLKNLQDEKEQSKKQELVKEFQKLNKEYEDRHNFWKGKIPEADINKALLEDSYNPAIKYYKIANEEYIPAVLAGDSGKSEEIMEKKLIPEFHLHKTHIYKTVEIVNKMCSEDEKSAASELKKYMLIISAVIITTFGLVIFIGLYIAKTVNKQLGGDPAEVAKIAHQVASGDLSSDIIIKDGFENSLMSAMKEMLLSLRKLVSHMTDISMTIATASNQLHSNSEQMSTSSEELTAQSASVATASEEMSATAADIARNCHLAAGTSSRASNNATQGAQVVALTVEAMNKIALKVKDTSGTISSLGTRSEQIGQIVGTIEDIADQTNLLALNAAIEAARAGEMGRGFAVVADEVRALAERTTKATKEISDMIRAIQKETSQAVNAMEEGVKEVEKGSTEAMKSGTAIEEILSAIDDVTLQINQIATAAEEQSATTHEITSNVNQITEVSDLNSKGAHESKASAEELARLADELKNVVNQFKL